MSIQTHTPTYILGQSLNAEHRLELLDELTCSTFVESMGMLPKNHVRILNIGCGSGHIEERLSKVFTDSHFVGIDFSAKRIEEARSRTGALKSSNTFIYIQADLTTLSVNELNPCDILISRFVLSHLSSPLQHLMRFLPLVKQKGYVCLEELASDCSEYYCNTNNPGYHAFVEMVELQIKAQGSSFDIGFNLLTELTKGAYKIAHCHMTQAILRTARHKSILRLGLEDAKSLDKEKVEVAIKSLRQFEEDELAFGLYSRSLALIAQTP